MLSWANAGNAMAVLTLLLALTPSALYSLWGQTLLPSPASSGPDRWQNFSVGFSLHSSYGAAAVILEGPDGERKTEARMRYGSPSYQETMARLSLASSRHIA
jgi:hypothetical protein